jgi:hypothetical protein
VYTEFYLGTPGGKRSLEGERGIDIDRRLEIIHLIKVFLLWKEKVLQN